MNSSLADIYFARALWHAGNADLSAAICLAAAALGMAPQKENAWKLAGLCYYQLGNYNMADYCFQQLTDERARLLAETHVKQEEMRSVIALVKQGYYKKAAADLAAADKTIGQWNYLGCLYAVLQQKEKAAECFVAVLKKDHSNTCALKCLSGLEQLKKRKWWNIW